jgi:hypothetical protein
MLMDEQGSEQIYKYGFCIMLSCMSTTREMLMTYTNFWPNQVKGEVFRKEHGRVPNSRVAPCERLAFNISVMFTRRSGYMIDIFKKHKIQY